MAFGDNARPKTGASDSTQAGTKPESSYLKLSPGEVVIRLLDKTENVFVYWRYYMPVNVGGTFTDRSITVGRDGPIKQFMDSIGDKDRRFRRPQKRVLSNVLERTNNTVKLLDYGSDMLDKFTTMHGRVRNRDTFQTMNVWEFDIRIVTTKTGPEPKDIKREAFPEMDQEPLAPELAALPIFDLSKVQNIMPDEYQARVLAGEDLIDILKELNWGKLTPTVPQS